MLKKTATHYCSMLQAITLEDLPAIQKLIEEEFPYIKKPLEQLEKKIENPLFFLFKVSQQQVLAGFCEVEILEENKSVRINGLAVFPAFRKKGFGGQLLQNVVSFLKEQQFETIWLLVKQKNRIARKLYEKEGFQHMRTLPKKIDYSTVEEYALELQPIA